MSDIVKNEIANSIYKATLSFLPGNKIIEEIYDFRGKVHQARLNKFSEFLKEGFEQIGETNINSDSLKKEDFIDAFDLILRKVVLTKSEEKLKRYKNVVLKQAFNIEYDSDLFPKYISLIEDINETQFMILAAMKGENRKTILSVFHLLGNGPLDSKGHESLTPEDDLTLHNGQTIKCGKISFLLHDLISKGLVESKNTNNLKSQFAIEYFELSIIGEGFLEFVKEYSEEL